MDSGARFLGRIAVAGAHSQPCDADLLAPFYLPRRVRQNRVIPVYVQMPGAVGRRSDVVHIRPAGSIDNIANPVLLHDVGQLASRVFPGAFEFRSGIIVDGQRLEDGAVDGFDQVEKGDLIGRAREQVAALRSADAADQSRPFQLYKDMDEIFTRYVAPLCNGNRGERLLGLFIQRKFDYRPAGIFAPGGDIHSAVRLPYFGRRPHIPKRLCADAPVAPRTPCPPEQPLRTLYSGQSYRTSSNGRSKEDREFPRFPYRGAACGLD